MSECRQLRSGSAQTGDGDEDADDDPDAVNIIELRRLRQTDGTAAQGDLGRRRGYDKRFWVSAHWRQQACGLGRVLRRPVWIAPHLKGPEGAPLSETLRVYAWRR